MSALRERLAALRLQGRKALVPFLTAGYPDLAGFFELLRTSGSSGADVIEIGLPFSDPLADGPTIQHSSSAALAGGYNLYEFLEALTPVAREIQQPLVAMTYVNPVLSYGVRRFAKDAAGAGFSGAIFPDLPLGEEGEIAAALAEADIDLVRLIAPTTSTERMARIASKAACFIYLVSVAGVTGERTGLPQGLEDLVLRVRTTTDLPVLIGFGISTPYQAAQAAAISDGVIVGSVLVRTIQGSGSIAEAVRDVSTLLGQMREAIDVVAGVVQGGIEQ